MLIRNVVHTGCLNGELLILKRWSIIAIYVQSIDGSERVQFAPHSIKFQLSFRGVKITRMQFPVRFAFAGTVYKARVQTLGKFLVDFISNCFSLGQNYVELSRVRKIEDVLLMLNTDDTLTGENALHKIPVAVSNPVPKKAVQCSEWANFQQLFIFFYFNIIYVSFFIMQWVLNQIDQRSRIFLKNLAL